MLRYFISGLYAFHVFNNSNKNNINKTIIQSTIYTILLTAFKIFIIDNPIITAISFISIFGCLIVTHKLKAWKVSLTYSLFVTCMLEYIHFLIFRLFSIVREALGIIEVTSSQPKRLLVGRLIVLTLYFISILLINKFNKVNIKYVYKFAEYSIFPIFLSIALCMIMYLKYYIKYTESNQFHGVLSIIFVFFIVLCLTFLFSSEAFLKKIENYKNKKTNQAIEEAKLQKGKNYSGLRFISENLNYQSKIFKNELYAIGIDTEDKKARQLVHCAVLLSQENFPEKVNMSSRIYSYTGEILGLQPKSIETNISNLLKNHWSSCDKRVLELIENNYCGKVSEENGSPTPKDFLLYLVKKHYQNHSVNKSSDKIVIPFFKKNF